MIRAAGMLHILETLFDTAVPMLWGFDLLMAQVNLSQVGVGVLCHIHIRIDGMPECLL